MVVSALAEKWTGEIQESLGESQEAPGWLVELRQKGACAFSESGLPHRKVEDWKYSSLKLLEARSHRLGSDAEDHQSDDITWPTPVIEGEGGTLRILNGRLLADSAVSPGIEVSSLENAVGDEDNEPWLREILESLPVEGAALAFSALNHSVLGRGVVIRVPANTDGGTLLLQWVFDNVAPAQLFNTRVVVVLEDGASLKLVDQFESGNNVAHALNLVTQIRIGNGARLNHTRVQSETSDTVLITRACCDVHESGQFQTSSFDWGAGWVRHDTLVSLLDDDANCAVNGAFVLSGEQHLDHHVFVDHAKGGSHSSQFFRGVLGDESRGVFNGKARICEGADGSSIRQSNANLLLSHLAEIDTKPELEIYADEVEASHGATVGQLDEDAVFYLRSRGLTEEAARNLLTSAFCKAVLDQSPDLPAGLGEEIASRMDGALR